MTETQRKILIGVGAVVLIMLIYPPYVIRGVNDIVRESGYAFLFDLPLRAQVDVLTLLVQWVGIMVAGAIAFFFFKAK
jgi:hypothetical protein